jgi:hypothetical protein
MRNRTGGYPLRGRAKVNGAGAENVFIEFQNVADGGGRARGIAAYVGKSGGGNLPLRKMKRRAVYERGPVQPDR